MVLLYHITIPSQYFFYNRQVRRVRVVVARTHLRDAGKTGIKKQPVWAAFCFDLIVLFHTIRKRPPSAVFVHFFDFRNGGWSVFFH